MRVWRINMPINNALYKALKMGLGYG